MGNKQLYFSFPQDMEVVILITPPEKQLKSETGTSFRLINRRQRPGRLRSILAPGLIFLSVFLVNLSAGPARAGTYTSSSHGDSTSGVDRSTIDGKYSSYSTGNCSHCHESHTSLEGAEPAPYSGGPSPGAVFGSSTNRYNEEEFCYECHDGGPATADIKTEFTTLTYKHGQSGSSGTDYMAAYNDRHNIGEESYTDYSGTQRHAECVDCHNPHQATASNPLKGVFGISPTTTPNWGTRSFSTVSEVSNRMEQYKVCYKCHSSWAGTGTGTSQAKEFSTGNPSYHNIEGNSNPPSSDSYGNFNKTYVYEMMPRYSGYTDSQLRNVTMICSDCHGYQTSDPQGVHGSSRDNILKVPSGSSYTEWDATVSLPDWDGTNNVWCFNCHDPNFDNSGFEYQHTGRHDNYNCQECHSAVPHGMKRERLIVYEGDPAPYNSGSATITYYNISTGNYDSSDCEASCSGRHDGGYR